MILTRLVHCITFTFKLLKKHTKKQTLDNSCSVSQVRDFTNVILQPITNHEPLSIEGVMSRVRWIIYFYSYY